MTDDQRKPQSNLEKNTKMSRSTLTLSSQVKRLTAEIALLKQQRDEAREMALTLMEAATRPEPSRLEIAAMLKAAWFVNRDADFNATDHKWWIEQADALIAAAKEVK